ncbi:MAG: hypothetical protein AAFQ29_01640, partial [Pseudomonadota bacterium]
YGFILEFYSVSPDLIRGLRIGVRRMRQQIPGLRFACPGIRVFFENPACSNWFGGCEDRSELTSHHTLARPMATGDVL